MTSSREMARFAARYAAAWSRHDAAEVASFYAPQGILAINGGTPSVGRAAIAEAAQAFMSAYPDLGVSFDRLEVRGSQVLFHWTFVGTNTGAGGTGARVRVSGHEAWLLGADGLIAESRGHYDAQDWARQIQRPSAAQAGSLPCRSGPRDRRG